MRDLCLAISLLFWLSIIANKFLVLWRDDTFMLWTALLFAIWALAWTVIENRQPNKRQGSKLTDEQKQMAEEWRDRQP